MCLLPKHHGDAEEERYHEFIPKGLALAGCGQC